MDGSPQALRCTFCGDSFKRREHLDRHLRRHSGSKPFTCKFCARSFSRKPTKLCTRDSLLRHASTHVGGTDSHGSVPSSAAASQRRFQACLLCSKSKRRCSGGIPCDPCRRKSLVCDLVDQSLAGAEPASLHTIEEDLFHPQAFDEAETLVPNSSGSGTPGDGTWADEGSAGVARLSVSDVDVDAQSMPEAMPSLINPDPTPGLRIPPGLGMSNSNATFDIMNDGLLPYAHSDFTAFSNGSFPWTPGKEGASFLSLENGGFGFVPVSTNGVPTPLSISERQVGEVLDTGTDAASKIAAPSQSSLEFPSLQPEDDDVLWAEDFRHAIVGSKQYQSIIHFFQKQSPQCDFPSQRVLSNFVQLYYEYFDIDFPMIHPSTLDRGKDSWILILSMATIGSQYSQISNGEQYVICLRELLLRIVASDLHLPGPKSLEFLQSLLLTQICLVFSGSMKVVMRMQIETNLLVHLCSRMPADSTLPDVDGMEKEWLSWIYGESRTRLLHCIFRLECLQVTLLDFPPIFHHQGLKHNLPSRETTWRCRTAQEWKTEIQSQRPNDGVDPGKVDIKSISPFAREMYAMMLFADERLLSVKPAVSSLRKSLIGPSTSTRALQVAKDADNPVQIPWVSSIASSVDKAFEVLVFGTTDELAQKGKYNLFHLLSIMRYIPLTHLYAFSMWRSSEAEAQESRDYLQTWMKREPVVSRQCLWHATMIFESIKRKRQHACYEPFTLLIAILTIWAFDTLSEPHNKAHSGWSDMDSVQPSTRINRLGTATEVESWARSAQNGGVFVDDIGLLRGSGSSRRLMMEGLQILSSGTAWPRLRAAIAHGVSEVLQGRPPSHPEE